MSILFKHKVNWHYAIGEVVLIFIGITLAIAFDSWNTDRQDKVTALSYIGSLEQEVQRNLEILGSRIERYDSESNVTIRYMRLLNAEDIGYLNNDSLALMVRMLGPFSRTTLRKSSYDDMISSGGLQYIKDAELRAKIMEVGRYYDVLELNMDRSMEYWVDMNTYYLKHSSVADAIGMMVEREIPELPFKIDREAFLNNRYFTNLLAVRLFRHDQARRYCLILQRLLIELKEQLEEFQ